MSILYSFYPEKDNPNFEKIKEDVIKWLTEKGKVKESECRKMEFNDLYDLFVSKQKEAIYSKSIDEHFESSKYFIEKMLDKKEYDKFKKKFDNYHRFFPEKVFKIAAARSYLDFSTASNDKNPLREKLARNWENGGGLNLYYFISHYSQRSGNCEFIKYYAFMQAKDIMKKYNIDYIGDYYKIEPNKNNYDPNWKKDLKQLKKSYFIYSNSYIYSPYKYLLDLFDNLEEQLENYIFMSQNIEDESQEIYDLGYKSKDEALSKLANEFLVAEEKFASGIVGVDIPMLIDQIKDRAKFYAMYKALGKFKPLGFENLDQLIEFDETCFNLASDYVVSSLGGKLKPTTEKSDEIFKQLAAHAERS